MGLTLDVELISLDRQDFKKNIFTYASHSWKKS